MGWCFNSHLVLRCTNMHQTNPFFSCLCLWSGSFTRILYFEVQTGTKTNLSLVFHVYGVVLLLASCTLVYKRAPEQAYFSCLWDGAFSHLVLRCTNRHPIKPFFSCLCLGWCFYSHLVLRCTNRHTKSNLVLWCTNMHQNKPF